MSADELLTKLRELRETAGEYGREWRDGGVRGYGVLFGFEQELDALIAKLERRGVAP